MFLNVDKYFIHSLCFDTSAGNSFFTPKTFKEIFFRNTHDREGKNIFPLCVIYLIQLKSCLKPQSVQICSEAFEKFKRGSTSTFQAPSKKELVSRKSHNNTSRNFQQRVLQRPGLQTKVKSKGNRERELFFI